MPEIAPASALPTLTAPDVTIDGTTQPGGWVELNGAAAGDVNGLELDGEHATVRGLVVNGFAKGDGILVAKGSGDVIAGDRIGSDPAGEAAVSNMIGVEVTAGGATIGGTDGTKPDMCAGDCDLVPGNSVSEILFAAGGSGSVQGDTIGPDLSGEKVLRFPRTRGLTVGTTGLFRSGPPFFVAARAQEGCPAGPHGAVMIGGASSAPGLAPGNVIAGGSLGVMLASDAVVAGNLIGLNRAGTRSLEGSILDGSSSNFPGLILVSKSPLAHQALPIRPGLSGVLDVAGDVIGGVVPADANVIQGSRSG